MSTIFAAAPGGSRIRQSRSIEVILASALTGVAGALNVTGFISAGVFSANMSGNVTSLADRVGGGGAGEGGHYLFILLLFVAGATIAALLLELVEPRRRPGVCMGILVCEALLLVALDGTDHLVRTHQAVVMVDGLSFLMGLQNALAARVSRARLRTTHVSGTSTDIGVSVGVLIGQLCRRGSACDVNSELRDLVLRVATLGAFGLGGAAAALVYPHIGRLILILAAGVLLGIGAPCLFQYMRGE